MRQVKVIGWVLVGVAVGFAIRSAGAVLEATQYTDFAGGNSVAFKTATMQGMQGPNRLYFASDAKGHGCWLVAAGPGGPTIAAIAPAPAESCK